MYCDFFGLRCRPFEDRADTQFFFTAADCEEALAAMDYEAHYGKGMALVLGEAGTGKTLLIRMLLQRLHASDHAVVLTWAQSGKMNLIYETAKAFGVSLPPSHQDARSLARLRRHLPRALKSNRRSILIIDQAENLTTDNLAELSTLGDLQHNGHKLLSIILVGHPRFRSLLEQPAFSRIAQQLYGEHTLSPLTASDTEKYVAHRLRISGAATVNLFDREAVALIHEASKGIPRLINHMCDAAMLAAYGAGEARISRETAAEVTSTTCPRERTAEARDLGILSVDRVAPGRASPTPGFLGQSSQTSEVVEDAPQPAEHSGLPLTDEHDSFSPAHGEENELIAVDTYRQEIATPQPASTMLHSEELLIRLERALARADRTNATTEASLAQFTAVEKHLVSLTEGAERLVGSLGQAAERGTESLDSAHVRLEDMLGQGGDCIRAIETQTARTSEVLREAREHADCVEHACEHADKVEARLKSIAERLADGADEVQDRVGLLMAGVGSGEETHNRLADLLKQASRIAGDFEGTVTGLRTKLQDTIDEGKRFQQTFTDSAFEAYRTKVNERIERYEGQALKAVESTQNKLESIAKQASSITTDANKETQSLRTTLAETKSEAERFLKLFTDSALRRCREKLQEQLEVHLRKQQDAIESAITAHRAKLEEVIDDAASRARTVDEALAASQKAGEEAIARSQRSHTETLEAINRKTELLRQQLDALDQREGRIRSSAASLSDTLTGTKAEVIALSDSVEGVEASVDELTTRADAAGTSLSNVVLHGEKLLVNVQTTVGQIEATQHRVAATLLEVGGACERIGTLREQATHCREIFGRLAAGQTESEKTAKQLEELMTSAKHLHEEIQGVMENADDSIDRLSAHNASAAKVLRNLSEANVTGQSLVEQTHESKRAITETIDNGKEQIERLVEDVWALTARSEVNAKALAEHNTKAGELIGKLDTTTKPAEKVAAELSQRVAQEKQHITSMTQECDQIKRETEKAAQRLAEQLLAAQRSFESGEPLLNEFIAQAQAIEQQLHHLQEKALSVERNITDATTRPAEIVASAQAQVGQLERVCAAVRKVFSGLSQASLEARKHSAECFQAGKQATARLSQLTVETDRAANTLHEWVEEALRAQSRLEKSLQACPSIRETHPADSIRRISTGPLASSRIANQVTSVPHGGRIAGAELEVLPTLGATEPLSDEKVARGPARPELISQLIEDAKRAVAVSKS